MSFTAEEIAQEIAATTRYAPRLRPLRGAKERRDEADRFLRASSVERAHIRRQYAQAHRARRLAALKAPRPIPRSVRPDKLTPAIRQHVRATLRAGVSAREVARRLNVSRATVARALREPMRRGRPARKVA